MKLEDQTLEVEQAVLGACLKSPELIEDIGESITSMDFYSATHQTLFEAITQLTAARKPVDLVSIGQTITDQGGEYNLAYASDLLLQSSASKASAMFHARSIKEYARAREVSAILMSFAKRAQKAESVDNLIADVQSQLGQMTASDTSQFVTLKQAVKATVEDIDRRFHGTGGLDGLYTGLTKLDERWQGMKGGQMIVMAARPSMGKSLIASHIATSNAIAGKNVLFFSLEMTAGELAMREIASKGNLAINHLKNPKKAPESIWSSLTAGVSRLTIENMKIDQTAGLHINQIAARSRVQHRRQLVDLVVIDHIHIVKTDKQPSREREMADISLKLKALAKELDCPVLAVAQLNRGVESRADKRPLMSDLRDSGSVEQDADIVSLVYRDDYYDDESPDKGTVEIITAKNRGGSTGTDRFAIQLDRSKVADLAENYERQESSSKWGTVN